MRTGIGAVVIAVTVAMGAVPAVVATVSATDDQRPATTAADEGGKPEKADQPAEPGEPDKADRADEASRAPVKPADKLADGKPGYGPPAHAHGKPQAHLRGNGPGPRTNPGKARGASARGLGPQHGRAMRAWASCVGDAAGNDRDDFDPEAACGSRPTPPGHLKRGSAKTR